jgi:hypothetical protein
MAVRTFGAKAPAGRFNDGIVEQARRLPLA